MRRRTLRLLSALAAGIAAGVLIGVVMPGTRPTDAAWVDRGGSKIVLNAVDEPPPLPAPPLEPGAGTIIVGDPIWTGQGTNPNPTPTIACFTIEIRTTSATPATWSVILHTVAGRRLTTSRRSSGSRGNCSARARRTTSLPPPTT